MSNRGVTGPWHTRSQKSNDMLRSRNFPLLTLINLSKIATNR